MNFTRFQSFRSVSRYVVAICLFFSVSSWILGFIVTLEWKTKNAKAWAMQCTTPALCFLALFVNMYPPCFVLSVVCVCGVFVVCMFVLCVFVCVFVHVFMCVCVCARVVCAL